MGCRRRTVSECLSRSCQASPSLQPPELATHCGGIFWFVNFLYPLGLKMDSTNKPKAKEIDLSILQVLIAYLITWLITVVKPAKICVYPSISVAVTCKSGLILFSLGLFSNCYFYVFLDFVWWLIIYNLTFVWSFPLRIRQLGPSLLDTCKCNFGISGLNLVRFSCNADQEQFSSPVNMDPFLLLKTLNFPPLTWVVQGFDMDLSDRTPMDHLYRYLEAHAHTGDRTLDTLFTQGISCLTMRTPTDLNKLREQVSVLACIL